ncbi:MAG TPA: DNA-3-methyladenine glycosylase [Planctomycetaceae bacterium]|jgi:DNA-3-methyladenine glycosylase II|nr:DNA-3-methyladenine glycosylase [Planctomycetaceae bacterium]
MPKVLRLSPAMTEEALAHLRSADPVMRRLIEGVGPFVLKPQRNRFQTLVRAIVSQQISSAAARSILARLETAVEPGGITPEAIARMTVKQMKAVGLSPQKQTYLKDLARHVQEGLLQLDRVGRMHDEEVIAELVAVKGIGRWTAQMFLIFTLGRPDVFPHDDLGVRTAIKKAYGLKELPNKVDAHRIAEPWRPYATVASWYCWRCLALPPEFFAEFGPPVLKSKAARGR